MTVSGIPNRSRHLVLAAIAALTAACKANESGAIPCNGDGDCPRTYAQCMNGSTGGAGFCAEAASGTPALASNAIAVAPAVITGGERPGLVLVLPALAPNANLARKVRLTVDSGAGPEAVVKTDGADVALTDLGKSITVLAPKTDPALDKTSTYTLTVSNEPSSPASTAATGVLRILPAPTLAVDPLGITPPSITGGLSPALTVALPSLTSLPSSAATVSLTVSGCGAGEVKKSDGSGLTPSDLGTTVAIDSPLSAPNDDKSCGYTLTVSNGATTPAKVTATGSLPVKPLPVLSGAAIIPTVKAFTSGSTLTIDLTLPSLLSTKASADVVTLTLSDGPTTVPQNKKVGGAVAFDDLGKSVTIDAPITMPAETRKLTYTLTVKNAAATPATAVASGTVAVWPFPVLNPNGASAISVAPAGLTAGDKTPLTVTLPSLNITNPVGATVTFKITGGTGCAPGVVSKKGGGAVGVADLGGTITIDPPASATTDTICTYTLDASNAADVPAKAVQAKGDLNLYEQPKLAGSIIVANPSSLTGGATGTIALGLPALNMTAAPTSVALTLKIGTGGAPIPVTKSGGVAIAASDLGKTVDVALPVTQPTDNTPLFYELIIANPVGAQAKASVNVPMVPAVVLSSSLLTIAPSSITGGTSPSLTIDALPTLSSGTLKDVSFRIGGDAACGSGDVKKTNATPATPVTKLDLGAKITFNPPTTTASDSATCVYTLTVTNSNDTPATAQGTLTIVATFAGPLTVVPQAVVGGDLTPGLLQFALPPLVAGTASSIAMTVTPPGSAVTKKGAVALVPADLGTTIAVDPPATTASTSQSYQYALTATKSSVASPPVIASVTVYPNGHDLANARIGGTATLLPNGKVLIVGGGASISKGVCAGATRTAEIYDPVTGTTTATADLTVGRCQHSAVLVAGATTKVFIFGGANTPSVDVFTYDQAASTLGTWQTSSALPTLQIIRLAPSATLLGGSSGPNAGKIVVAGGYSAVSTATWNNLELFDPGNGTSVSYVHHDVATNATVPTRFNVGRAEHVAVLAGKWLYFVGGFDPTGNAGGPNYSPSIDAVDTTLRPDDGGGTTPNQLKHTDAPANSIGRSAHSGIALSSTSLLIAGGYDGTNTSRKMQTYTVDSGSGAVTAISAAQNLNIARARFALLPAGPVGKVLVLGGTTTVSTTAAADTATNSIEVIDAAGTLSTSNLGTLTLARQANAAVDLGLGLSNSMFVVAGGSSSGAGGVELIAGP